MRACFYQKTGPIFWTDDDSPEPLNVIRMYGLFGMQKSFTYTGTAKFNDHEFRQYHEIVTEHTQ